MKRQCSCSNSVQLSDVKMFKKSSWPPAAKASSFTADQILSDLGAVTKASEYDGDHLSVCFTPSPETEAWFAELRDITDTSNRLIDALESNRDKRDELIKHREAIDAAIKLIQTKTKRVLNEGS